MKRASYREAVAWIAYNDDPGSSDSRDAEAVRGMISVGLVADIFGVDSERVAADVVRIRVKENV